MDECDVILSYIVLSDDEFSSPHESSKLESTQTFGEAWI